MCTLILIILLVMQGPSQTVCFEEAAKIISPLVYTAWQGQQTNGGFICSVNSANSPRWIVNGNLEDTHVVYNLRGIRVHTDWDSVPGRVISHIYIPVIQENSNGVICKCRAYISGSVYVESDETGIFSVQGYLQMLPNVTAVKYNRSHTEVSWNEPFTLNITEVEPDIFGFTICTVMPNTVIQDSAACVNTTAPSITLPRFSFGVNLTISAWNIVGESNRVVYGLEPVCNVQTVWEVATFIFFPDHPRSAEITFIPVDSNGQDSECLESFLVEIVDLKGNTTLEKSFFGYRNSNLTVEFELQRDTEYSVLVKSFLLTDYVQLYQTNFNTYDVQRVDINATEGGVWIICQFVGGSSARGFKVEILNNRNLSISRYISINECTLNQYSVCTASTLFSELELGNLGNVTIVVYDWERDGSITTVYSEELAVITVGIRSTQSTDSILVTDAAIDKVVTHSTQSTGSTLTTDPAIDKVNQWDVIGSSTAGGFCIIVIFLFTVAVLVRMRKKKKIRPVKEKLKPEDKCQPNNAYALMLGMRRNMAYEQGPHFVCHNIPSAEPHVYEVIHTPRGSPTEPVYTTIT